MIAKHRTKNIHKSNRKVFIQNVKKEMIVNIKLIIQSKILHIFSFCGNNFSKAPTNNIRNMTTSNNVSDIYYTSETTFSSAGLNLKQSFLSTLFLC